jgi:serine protease
MLGNYFRINLRRSFLLSCLAVVCGILFAAPQAFSVEIDKGLKDALSNKVNDKVPVLMIYHEAITVDDLILDLDGLTPDKRRRSVLEALKKKNRKIQSNAVIVLDDPDRTDEVGNIRVLYLAGAIAFDATRAMVETLGGLDDNATLYYDQGFDFISGTQRGDAPDIKTAIDRADTAWGVKWIDADRVWNELGYTGSGVIVGHIDSGIWLTHPDLLRQIANNAGEIPGNGIDDDNNGYIDDNSGWDFGDYDNNPNDDATNPGHGTHTAGTVAGDGTGGTVTGVAPGAKLLPCKVADSAGSMTFGAIWEAEQYCAENGARVITMSLGAAGTFPASYMRTERVIGVNLRGAGVAFFNSAGNEHFTQDPPVELGITARVPSPWTEAGVAYSHTGGVITVGGTGYRNNSMYTSSSRGPAKWDDVDPYNDWPYLPGDGLIKPDVSAPGVGVNSTVIPSGYSGDSWSGTSMACPHVAGVAALMLEKNPSLSPAGIDSLLQLNAVDYGVAGKDNDYGAGRIDAYATLMATPETMYADLHPNRVIPDPDGDDVLDPGGASTLAFELMNSSTMMDAVGVTGKLAIVDNHYVTVSDEDGTFGDIAMNGGTGNNVGDTFGLLVDAAAPQGFEFSMILTVQSTDGFERTFDLTWYVGLPEWRTHDQGGMYLTVTDQGIIGYMTQDGAEGDGMGLTGEGSGLFVGSFWAGTGLSYICNRDYAGVYPTLETYEWEVVSDPNGRVRDLTTSSNEQVYSSLFSDSGHASPQPLLVEQNSYAYSDGPDNQFVIMEYNLTNEGTTTMFTLYTGIFCDFDIGNSGANVGGTDEALNLSYLNAAANTGPYFGIALLGDANTATNLTMINNPLYVYDNSSIEDSMKMRHLRGNISVPATTGPDDWSALTSKVVALDANGGTATVAYAMVVGATLEELQANVTAANNAYNPGVSPVGEEAPRQLVKLAQNHPNPFNPSTSIKFGVARDGHVELAVYDLGGHKVRTLVSESRSSGDYSVTWDGKDDQGSQTPSGLYFYRLTTDGKTISRKMTLVK